MGGLQFTKGRYIKYFTWIVIVVYGVFVGLWVPARKITYLSALVGPAILVLGVSAVRWGPVAIISGLLFLNTLLPVNYLPNLSFSVGPLDFNPVYGYLVLAAVAAVTARWYILKQEKTPRSGIIVGFGVVISVLITALISPDRRLGLSLAQYWIFTMGFPLVLGFSLIRTELDLFKLFQASVWLNLVVGGYGVAEWLLKTNPLYEDAFPSVTVASALMGAERLFRVRSTIGHPVVLGAVLAMLLPITLVYTLKVSNYLGRVVGSASLFVGAAALVLTFSRGSWVAATAGFLVVLHYTRRKWGVTLAAIVLGVLLVIGSSAGDLVAERLSKSSIFDTVSFSHRFLAYRVAAKALGESPVFGGGFGSYRLQYDQWLWAEQLDLPTPDNGYILLVVESGLLGLTLVLTLMVAVVKHVVRLVQRGPEGERLLYAGLMGAFIAFALNGFTFDIFTFFAPQVLFWTLAGAAWSRAQEPVSLANSDKGLLP